LFQAETALVRWTRVLRQTGPRGTEEEEEPPTTEDRAGAEREIADTVRPAEEEEALIEADPLFEYEFEVDVEVDVDSEFEFVGEIEFVTELEVVMLLLLLFEFDGDVDPPQ